RDLARAHGRRHDLRDCHHGGAVVAAHGGGGMKRAWMLVAGLSAVAWPCAASAQTAIFGFSFGGQGAAMAGPSSLDARLRAAGRPPVIPLGGGFGVDFEGSYRMLRLTAGVEWSFMGNDTVPMQRINGFLMAGLRLRHEDWVVLPSLGFAYSSLEMCTK